MGSPRPPADAPANPFLTGPIPAVFARTALPIVLMTSVTGLLTIVDAMLLGGFVGAEALTAVTLIFPISMLLTAASSMVGIGLASLLGRKLGAGDLPGAARLLASAQGLALLLSAIVIVLFALAGAATVNWVAGGNAALGAMGWTFLAITIGASPVTFILSVQSDALRAEGRVGFMAITGVLLTLANIALNVVLIGGLQLGVAGSAWGTVLAQVVAIAAIATYRAKGKARLPLTGIGRPEAWGEMLALGAPRSLNFIGVSLGSAAILFSLQRLELPQPEITIAAYGVVMRLMTFAFLPLMGMSLGLQAIVGNNAGAGRQDRVAATLKLALVVSFGYCLVVEAVLLLCRELLGGMFVGDMAVAIEVARIVPIYVVCYFAFGPVMMVAAQFQAIGDVKRAAVLSLARTYLFAIPLTLFLPFIWGETGVWAAAPAADLLALGLTALVARQANRAVRPAVA